MPDLKEKEFSLIREIAKNLHASQRELARASGLSLGLTNLMLKRLSRKGFVKVKPLDWRRTRYALTPKGMMEKARKSYFYAAWTLKQLKQLVDRVRKIILEEYRAGRRDFYIVSQAEAADIVQMALEGINLFGARIHRLSDAAEAPENADVIFVAAAEAPDSGRNIRRVSLFDETDRAPQEADLQPRPL